MNSVIEAIRAKYPQYDALPDDELTKMVGEKYPQYFEREDFGNDFRRIMGVPETVTPQPEVWDTAPKSEPAPPEPVEQPIGVWDTAPSAKSELALQKAQAEREGNRAAQIADVIEGYENVLSGPAGVTRQAEKVIESATGKEFTVRPSEILQRQAFGKIPEIQVDKNAPWWKKAGAGVANSVIGLGNFLQTPEAVVIPMLPRIPVKIAKPISQAVNIEYSGQLATQFPEVFEQWRKAYERGDVQAAWQYATLGLSSAAFSALMAKAALHEPKTFLEAQLKKIKNDPAYRDKLNEEFEKPEGQAAAAIDQTQGAGAPATAAALKVALPEAENPIVIEKIEAPKVKADRTQLVSLLRQEGVSDANAQAIISGEKSVSQVVDEQLGVFKPKAGGLDASTMIVEERPDGGRDIGFADAGPATTTPKNVGTMSHSDAVELARQEAIERIRENLLAEGYDIWPDKPTKLIEEPPKITTVTDQPAGTGAPPIMYPAGAESLGVTPEQWDAMSDWQRRNVTLRLSMTPETRGGSPMEQQRINSEQLGDLILARKDVPVDLLQAVRGSDAPPAEDGWMREGDVYKYVGVMGPPKPQPQPETIGAQNAIEKRPQPESNQPEYSGVSAERTPAETGGSNRDVGSGNVPPEEAPLERGVNAPELAGSTEGKTAPPELADQPPKRPDFREFPDVSGIKEFGKAHDKWKADLDKWLKTIPKNKALIFQGENSTFAITKDPKGGWRYTYFSNSDKMPTGHESFPTRSEALQDLLSNWGNLKRLDKMPFEPLPLPARMYPGDTVIWHTPGTGEDVSVNFRGFLGGEDAGKAVVVTESGQQITVDAMALRAKPPPAVTPEVKPAAAEKPAFAARYDPETLLQRPAWVEPGSAFDKVLGELRDKQDRFYDKDVTGIWKSLTPEQRQDLAARGWITTSSRVPGQVLMHLSEDAVAAKKYYGMQNRIESKAKPAVTPKPTRDILEEDANDFIKSALASKKPPKTADEAWAMYRRNVNADTRGTPVVDKAYFDDAWNAFTGAHEKAKAPAVTPKKAQGKKVGGISMAARVARETEITGPDIISWIVDNGKLLSKSAAKRKWTKDKWNRNKSEWDGAAPLESPHHNLIYSDNGSPPDQVANAAFRAGIIKEESVDALWDAIKGASKNRKGARARELKLENLQTQEADFIEHISERNPGEHGYYTDEMNVGDKLIVDGVEMEIIRKDANTGELTLKDGKRFGVQVLPSGKKVYVEQFVEGESVSAEFAPEEPKAPAPAIPRIPAGQKTGDLLANVSESFKLVGERTSEAKPAKATPAEPPEMFTVQQAAATKDWVKGADDAIRIYGTPAKAIEHLQNQLRTIDSDPETAKTFSQEQRAGLKSVLSELQKRHGESPGPGAAARSDVGVSKSELVQLTESLQNVGGPKQDPIERVKAAAARVAELPANTKHTLGEMTHNAVSRLSAIGGAIKSGLTKLPDFTSFKRTLGKWDGANQIADFELRKFVKQIYRTIKRDRQVAITNYIQADGDVALLRQRAEATRDPKLRRGYEAAQTLTHDEKIAAQNISAYLDAMLQEGIDSGILEHGVENYITQIWKRDNPVTRKLLSDISIGKLQPNFRYARKRVFDSYFEGEQAGFKPANKEVGALISAYSHAFQRSLSARAFIRNLTAGKASDGQLLVDVSGSGKMVEAKEYAVMGEGRRARRVYETREEAEANLREGETIEERNASAILVRPQGFIPKAEDGRPYRIIDHPALRKYKWTSTAPDGTSVMLEGQLAVHPEIYQHLRNVLSTSVWRTNPIGRTLLKTNFAVKEMLLSFAAFHQVQEGLHALGHRISPFRTVEFDARNPLHVEAVQHGLQIADFRGMELFSEGLASGPILKNFPLLGPIFRRTLVPYTEYLFQSYIPGLKMSLFEHQFARNMKSYAAKASRDQILELTAKQVNAAFGELNYKWMGRNPSFQDTLRAFLLAPDFLEARGKFVGQAFKGFGKQQFLALALLAATQYVGTRILNQWTDDDPHWDLEHMFSVINKGKSYSLRTVPGDILHLFSNTHQFWTARISPIMRTAVTAISGRDWRGVKRDWQEQIKDFLATAIPMPLRKRDDQTMWESLANSVGLHIKRFTAGQEIFELARKWKDAKGIKETAETIESPDSPYRKMKVALDMGDDDDARAALQELLKTRSRGVVNNVMVRGINFPFTGNMKREHEFKKTLTAPEKAKYEQAISERRERYKRFRKILFAK